MLVKYIVSLVAALTIISQEPAVAEAPVVQAKQPVSIEEKIAYYADKHKADKTIILNVINCESSMNPNAVGDGGNSFGLSQIHLPSHPNITKEQALNEDYAIEFMAKNINTNPRMWTCWRILYG